MARKSRMKLRAGYQIGPWKLIRRLGAGGNGEVWEAEQPDSPRRAIKLLRRIDEISLARFEAETEALKLAGAVPGIVPLLELGAVHGRFGETPWFVMPLARPINTKIGQRSGKEIVGEFARLAETLSALHDLQIYHRDIKPANILVLDDRLCFSDFGLVKYPKRPDLTPNRQDVGPKFTMAPEMRRMAARAAGGPADVYSFAKTLWIALTGDGLGFDGQYLATGNLALSRFRKDEYVMPLDELLSECTDNDPAARPTIDVVHRRLLRWLTMMEDFDDQNDSEWTEIQNSLFPSGVPTSTTWTDIDGICTVLRLIGRQSLNHMFFPDGGGMTLTGVTRSRENQLIELQTGFLTVLKPAKLTFESFGAESHWNYFRLETAPIDPTGTEDAYLPASGYKEVVVEMAPDRYVGPDAWENGELEDDPDAPNARQMSRYLKGSFAIFSTASAYNRRSQTYDARHEKMSETDFRAYMRRNVDASIAMRAERAAAAEAQPPIRARPAPRAASRPKAHP